MGKCKKTVKNVIPIERELQLITTDPVPDLGAPEGFHNGYRFFATVRYFRNMFTTATSCTVGSPQPDEVQGEKTRPCTLIATIVGCEQIVHSITSTARRRSYGTVPL